MGKLETGRPSPGTIMGAVGLAMGFAALIVSLSGIATAQPSRALIHKGDIAPGAVTAKTIARGAVRASAIARGAVTSKAFSRGAVTGPALAKGAVGTATLADNAVTSRILAPGSVYGGALGEIATHTTLIKDLDAVAENGTWTASNGEVAKCGLGERLLSAGPGFKNPGNREAAFLEARPFSDTNESGAVGRITTNSGGTAEGEIVALCLK